MARKWSEIAHKMASGRIARLRRLVRRELFRIRFNDTVYRIIFWLQKYVFLWSICTECNHPNRWHIYSKHDSHPYCWPRLGQGIVAHCSCGYHAGR